MDSMGILLQCDAVMRAPGLDRLDVQWADLSQCERVARAWYALAEGASPQAAGAMAATLLALADGDDTLDIGDQEVGCSTSMGPWCPIGPLGRCGGF